jgi:hypothetical protein
MHIIRDLFLLLLKAISREYLRLILGRSAYRRLHRPEERRIHSQARLVWQSRFFPAGAKSRSISRTNRFSLEEEHLPWSWYYETRGDFDWPCDLHLRHAESNSICRARRCSLWPENIGREHDRTREDKFSPAVRPTYDLRWCASMFSFQVHASRSHPRMSCVPHRTRCDDA